MGIRLSSIIVAAWFGAVSVGSPIAVNAQSSSDIGRALAPAGKLRVGVLKLSYFMAQENDALTGVIPDLGRELARRADVAAELIQFDNPGSLMEAFKREEVDVTFIGLTADRAAVFDFGPGIIDIQTTYLVPAASPIGGIAEVDRPGVRIVAPQKSAQDAFLRKSLSQATIINVAVETPRQAVELLASGQAEAFSHVAPMLALAQPDLPGSRILPGSYFNVPVSIGYAKGRSPAVADFCRLFAADVKASGFVAQAIARMGVKAQGLVAAGP
jgi:polar amino acid transport system substrate-binding protein